MKTFAVERDNGMLFSQRRLVNSGGAATIARGTPTKEDDSGGVAIMVDGNGTTSERFSGLAKSVSTDTAAADGVVDIIVPLPGILYRGSPKVSGAADTQAEIDALGGKRVVFDLTASVWTIDSAASDDIGNGVVIAGGRYEDDLLFFYVTHSTINFFENN